MSTKRANLLEKGWLLLLFLMPIILWILPPTFFEGDEGIIVCPSRLFFDFECLGCGMTRAVMHMHHFQFSEALFFNFGVVATYPGLVIFWCIWVRDSLRRLQLIPPGKIKEKKPRKLRS